MTRKVRQGAAPVLAAMVAALVLFAVGCSALGPALAGWR